MTNVGREVQAWADWELELLESRYCLDGSAVIMARTGRSADSIRQKATRLQLRAEMDDYTPASDVRRLAGVTERAVRLWIDDHHYRHHTRTWGRLVLLPAPMVRLYLHDTRTDKRPAGWWGRARTADHLNCEISTLPKTLTYRTVGRTRYYDPHEVRMHTTPAPPATLIRLRDIHPKTGPAWTRALHWLAKAGHSVERFPRYAQGKPSPYINETAARAFLTARGHREEMVETIIRRGLSIDTSKIKEDV